MHKKCSPFWGVSGPHGTLGKGLGVLALAGLVAWSWPAEAPLRPQGGGAATGQADGDWQPYDEQALQRFAAEGRPVFVDCTAAWCVGGQVNKRLVLHTEEALQAFQRANVVLMRADWTRRDATITQALARLGRNGVPVYVLLRPGREPLLLPEILSQSIVREALATLQP